MGEKQFCGAIGSQKLQEPPAHFARFWTAKLQMSNMRGLGQLEVPFQDDTFTPKNCLFVFPDIQWKHQGHIDKNEIRPSPSKKSEGIFLQKIQNIDFHNHHNHISMNRKQRLNEFIQ